MNNYRIILIVSSISSVDIISMVLLLPDPQFFLCIAASSDDAAAFNPNGRKHF